MKHLIIGPGSMIIYSFIGALKCLHDHGKLSDLQEISCSSTGSILGFFYVITNGDFEKMFQCALEAPMDVLAKTDLKTLVRKFGLINTDRFEKYISKTAKKITEGVDPTFAELYAMNPIKLYIPTVELISNRTIYMSVDTTPDMKVSHAVRRSISVPFIMSPHWEKGCIYVDGSLQEISPFTPFLGKTDVSELRFAWNPSPMHKPKTFFEYMYLIVKNLISTRLESNFFEKIEITTDIDIFNFAMSNEEKLKCYTDGYSQIIKIISV